jgi:phosphoribosylglycinamide formyltransferase-1
VRRWGACRRVRGSHDRRRMVDEPAILADTYTRPRHETHRRPDFRPRLQHGGHRAALRGRGLAGTVVAVIANRPTRRPGVCACSTASPAWSTTAAWPERAAFDAALARAIDAHEPDLVVLAGFMRILGAASSPLRRPAAEHPSVAAAGLPGPAHPPPRLEAGCKLAGATVHFVTPELDHGPIVMQAVVPVQPGDDEHVLAARVLATEHVIYPQSVRWFVEGLVLRRGRVRSSVSRSEGPAWWRTPRCGSTDNDAPPPCWTWPPNCCATS